TEEHEYPIAVETDVWPWIIDAAPMIRAIARDVVAGRKASRIAGAFHRTLASVSARVAARLRERTGICVVALSGGAFQNALLTAALVSALERRGFTVLTHRLAPCNDGGISLGQAWIAAQVVACA